MNNKKKLVEQRNTILSNWENIIQKAEMEKRSLTEIDQIDITNYKNKIKNIDAKLAASNSGGKKLEKRGMENMNNNKLQQEKTNIERFLRRETNEESRSLEAATTVSRANNGELAPTSVYDEIIVKLGESSPVFEAANKLYTANGNLKVARETELFDTGFIGETYDAEKLNPKLEYATLTTKRVGAALQLTRQLALDSGVDVVEYASSVLARSAAKTIERGILLGHKEGEEKEYSFAPIVDDPLVEKLEMTADEIDVETLLDLYTGINPTYLANSMLVVSRDVFNSIVKMKDGDGTFLIFRQLVDGRPGYKLFGTIPVYVSDILGNGSGVNAVFGDFSAGYMLAIKKDMEMSVISGDTTQALAGGILTVLDAYLDGAVVNPASFIVIKDPAA